MEMTLELAEKVVKRSIENHSKIDNRVLELENMGFTIEEKAMGSGGVGQVRTMKSGEVRIQIGCGHSRHNYAKCVIL